MMLMAPMAVLPDCIAGEANDYIRVLPPLTAGTVSNGSSTLQDAHALTHADTLRYTPCSAGDGLPVKQGHPPLIIGIDPDGSGALAAVQVQAVPQPNAQVIHEVNVELHDNPVEIFQSTTRKRR